MPFTLKSPFRVDATPTIDEGDELEGEEEPPEHEALSALVRRAISLAGNTLAGQSPAAPRQLDMCTTTPERPARWSTPSKGSEGGL